MGEILLFREGTLHTCKYAYVLENEVTSAT